MTAATLTRSPGSGFSRISAGRKAKNGLATVLVTGSFLVALVPLVWLLWTVISKGWHYISRAGWFTSNERGKTFGDPGGGVLHAIIGTLEQVALCTAISVPIAMLVGIYLVEYGRGWFARTTTFMVDILTGVPSIVAALFIYTVFISTFGTRGAGWLVSFALVMLMIPVIVRTTEEMLRLVPNELREASYALGVPKWLTIAKVVLPTAIAGITTGVMLSISRVIGETAPLLLTAGVATSMNYNLFEGRMMTLPVFAYSQYMNQGIPAQAYIDRAWAAAFVLIIIVMALNLIARLVAKIFAPKLGR